MFSKSRLAGGSWLSLNTVDQIGENAGSCSALVSTTMHSLPPQTSMHCCPSKLQGQRGWSSKNSGFHLRLCYTNPFPEGSSRSLLMAQWSQRPVEPQRLLSPEDSVPASGWSRGCGISLSVIHLVRWGRRREGAWGCLDGSLSGTVHPLPSPWAEAELETVLGRTRPPILACCHCCLPSWPGSRCKYLEWH